MSETIPRSPLRPLLATLTLGLAAACASVEPPAGDGEHGIPGLEPTVANGFHLVRHAAPDCPVCEVYQESQEWVVRIESQTGTGTGVIVAVDGRLVTNAHVVGLEGPLSVETAAGAVYPATRLHVDVEEDLALLRVEAQDASFRPVSIEAGPPPTIGSPVYAIGHPVGLGWSVTSGIVSALRELGSLPMIQTDAPISPGNSGGPLLDAHGHVVGIVTSKVSVPGAENLAFARPSEVLLEFLVACGVPEPEATPSR